ncbi:MAG: hypothetical protein U0573_13930 [Phycisphaerales bacterium]|nr:hypothetical protein [Planctomycetota bacterium]
MHLLIRVTLVFTSAALTGCAGIQSQSAVNSAENVKAVAPENAPPTVAKAFPQAVVFAYRVMPTKKAGEFDTDGGSTAIVLAPSVIQTARHAIHSPLNRPLSLYLIRRQTTGTVLGSAEKSEQNGDWVLLQLDKPVWGRDEHVGGLSFENLPIRKGEPVFLLGYLIEGSDNIVPAIVKGAADSDFATDEPVKATIDSRLRLDGMSGGALAVERNGGLVVVGSLRQAADPADPRQPFVICSRLPKGALQAAK